MEEAGKKNAVNKTGKNEGPSFAENVKSFCKGVKGEFKKVIWPNKTQLQKQTIAVVAVSVALGAFIRLYDMLCQAVISFIR